MESQGGASRESAVWAALVLQVALVGLYLICTPLRDLWYPDEPDVARVVQEMVRSGHWLRPTLMGSDFASYPPLFYWVAGLSVRLGALSGFFLRLPSVLAAGALLCVTWLWVRRRIGALAGVWAVAVLGTTYLFFQQATHVHVDMLFAAFFGTAIFAFDAARRPDRGVAAWGIAASGLAMGLAALTKGPLGILLPGAILVCDSALRRRWRDMLLLVICGMLGATVFIIWAWFYAEVSGPSDLLHFLWHQNVARFTESGSHERPFYYYLLNFPADAMPWALFLLAALPWVVRRAWSGRRPYVLLASWFGLGFIFFSVASSKRSVYLLPLYPAMAGLVAVFLAERASTVSLPKSLRAAVLVVGVLFALGGVAIVAGSPMLAESVGAGMAGIRPLAALEFVLAAGGVLMLALLFCGCARKALYLVPAVAALVFVIVFGWLMPAADVPLSARADGEWLDARIDQGQGERLAMFNRGGGLPKEATSLAFYGDFNALPIETTEHLAQYWRRQPGGVVVVEADEVDALRQLAGMELEIMWTMRVGSDELVAVRPAETPKQH